jgi:uncharacterized protein
LIRVLLISDSHGHLDPAILRHVDAADEVWHGGDIGSEEIAKQIQSRKPFRAVYGNIDSASVRSLYPEDLVFETGGVKTLITHIAGSPPAFSPRVNLLIHAYKPSVLVCGHSHILKVQFIREQKLLYMNPGACGHHGFHRVRTALRFTIADAEITDLEVIELGRRGQNVPST